MTRINPEDPKWTAYVLGELDDAERAAIELELEASEEARTLVEELRFAAQLTKMELREAVAASPLTEAQRESIHAAAEVRRPRRWFRMPQHGWTTALAAAGIAILVLGVSVSTLFRQKAIPNTASTAETRLAEANEQNEQQVRRYERGFY